MKFNFDLLYKIIMAILTVLLGANQYQEHLDHVVLKEVLTYAASASTESITFQ